MTSEPLLRRLIGAVLRDRRATAGRTLRDVADEARVSVAYLSEVERGRKEASSEVLVAVAGALGMRLVDLLAAAHDELLAREQAVRGAVVVDLASRTPRTVATAGPVRAPARLTGAARPGALLAA